MSEEVRIREATMEDYEALCGLFHALDQHHVNILPDNFQSFPRPVRSQEQVAVKMADPDKALFVAEAGNRLVGFGDVQRSSNPPYPMFKPREYALIENIYVDPDMRGTGLAHRLLEAVKNWSRRQNLKSIQLHVYSANELAIRFYEKEGFVALSNIYELRIAG
jgi:ribosomal protein S18 acetylase RimI-like enzyme